MRAGLEFALGLLDERDPADVALEDLDGPHGPALACFRRMGFLAAEPGMSPVPSCPECHAGTPYRLDDRYVCNRCRSAVDVGHLQLWRLDIEALLRWLAREQGLRGGVQQVDDGLWRLGTLDADPAVTECFYLRGQGCSDFARRRLTAFQSALVLHGKPERPDLPWFEGRVLALLDLLDLHDGMLAARPIAASMRRGGAVSFDRRSGMLVAGEATLGRIPPDTREFHLLAYLADYAGEVVAYADLKRYVCAKADSQDEADEATFCQKLKSRIKRAHGIAAIDRVIRTDRRGGGYVLLPELELGGGVGLRCEVRRVAGGSRSLGEC